MLKALITTFGASPRQVRHQQLHDAQIQLLHHAAKAEEHAALAVMYRDRCDRLSLDETPDSRIPFMVGMTP